MLEHVIGLLKNSGYDIMNIMNIAGVIAIITYLIISTKAYLENMTIKLSNRDVTVIVESKAKCTCPKTNLPDELAEMDLHCPIHCASIS
jgi:2C-methyl-D-erythritol 2,4-cyclodiphosphate synthase